MCLLIEQHVDEFPGFSRKCRLHRLLNPTFLQEFFHVTSTQWIRHVPAHTHQNNIRRKCAPLKLTAIVLSLLL